MIVADASTIVHALTDGGDAGERCRRVLHAREPIAAPPHFRVEVLRGIRGRYLCREIDEETARTALRQLVRFTVRTPRKPHEQFDRIWELRHNLTAYDAAYVALAEARGCALVTADARLAATPGLRCEVRLATAA